MPSSKYNFESLRSSELRQEINHVWNQRRTKLPEELVPESVQGSLPKSACLCKSLPRPLGLVHTSYALTFSLYKDVLIYNLQLYAIQLPTLPLDLKQLANLGPSTPATAINKVVDNSPNKAHQGLSKRDMASNLNSSQFYIEKVKRHSFSSKLCGAP
ncbi:unnamed protein product [Ranitomeya imitator]|uniref:Uncharacterized protein n=1 Tax=Ranitomeya imitator TaxID=111125 RepID=A0ABN9MLC8_9NEOB|nr:unnamed protein product [Ranitomeya imitator]